MTLRIGLIGAGPWAREFHAPMLTQGPGTTLEAVWGRRSEAAEALAADFGTTAASTVEALLDRCDAVAFAVPPDVQAQLAPQAAAAGKHLILEKPLAFTLDDAERIAEAVGQAGVQTVLMLRNRFTKDGRDFVAAARAAEVRGGQASFVTSAALPGSMFATPWRIERGALFDLGPHVLDLLDAAMGPIVKVSATGDSRHFICLTTEHENGARGQLALSSSTPQTEGSLQCTVFTEHGPVVFDGVRSDQDTGVAAAIVTALVTAVDTGQADPIDVHRGVHLQRLLVAAESSLHL